MEKQGLNELAAAVHENAVAHGWWDQERELPEILMLCVSELAEALEEYRAGKPNIYYNVEGEEILYADGEACEKHERRKPEGVAVELADCMIRILDYCGHAGIDIEEAIRIKHEYSGLSDVRNEIYSINSMGQDGDTYLTEVAETYQQNMEEIDITFGESLPALITQIRQITK